MIIKASERGGGKQLGLHLLKTEENEHVEIHEIRNFASDDVVGALKEAYAVSRGTKCQNFLFSVSLNPPETEKVGVEVFENTADRIEERLGLTDHPRVIVFHEKEGRRHAHAVWSRIDADSMTAVNLSHYKLNLREISKQLYLENDWKLPRGLMDSEARDPRNFDLSQWQQAKRIGQNARDLKAMMQECWAASDSRAAFAQALKERGLVLAKGDKRGHVAITHEGEVLSVARYTSKKAKEVRAKLGEPDTLPGVDETKTRIAQDMSATFQRLLNEAREKNTRETAPLDARRRDMIRLHQGERLKIDAAQKERWAQETRERQERFNRGIRGVWDRLSGQHARTRKENEAAAYAALQRDREQRDALVSAQLGERQELQQQIREARKSQAKLLTELWRDRKTYQQALKEQFSKSLDKPEKTDQFQRAPVGDTKSRLEKIRSTPSPGPATPAADQFRRAANPPHTQQDRLQELRNQRASPQTGKAPEPDRQ